MTTPFSAPTIPVTVTKAIPNNLATQLSLTGAQQAVGQELTLKADDALMLVRNGYAYITKAADNSGRGTEGIQGVHAFTLDFPSVAAGAAAALTVNVVSAAVSDPVILGAPALLPAGVIPVAFVSAAGVVTIRIENQSAAAVDLAASVWKVALLKGAAN